MSGIRSNNTAIEIQVRRALHSLGLRYRLGGAGLPGRPDIVLPKFRSVVFVHGCFWHGHNCSFFRLPKSNIDFWQSKIKTNQDRDRRVIRELRKQGWRSFVIRECQLRGKPESIRAKTFCKLAERIRAAESVT